jgi:hypothetical protein
MNTDDIIRMAKEAAGDDWGIFRDFMPEIERFAELVAAAVMPKEALAEMFEWGKDVGRREEREACAQIAYDYTVKVSLPNFFESAEYVAAAIRARGQE